MQNNKNIIVHEAKPIKLIKIFNLNIIAVHGQNDKKLQHAINNISNFYNTDIDILLSGHLHSKNNQTVGIGNFGAREFIQFDSICGIEGYSEKLRKISPAGTSLLILDNESKNRIRCDICLQD